MIDRYIEGFDGLERLFVKLAVEEHVVINETMAGATAIMKHHVKKNYGDRARLPELKQWTQDEREALGFSPDEPLLRDGSLLRDSVHSDHLGPFGEVGSNELIALYSEKGYANARTGTTVPPRPVWQLAIGDAKEEIITAFMDALSFIFTGRIMRYLLPSDED